MKPVRITMAAFAGVALLMACDTATDPADPQDPPNQSNVCNEAVCAANSSLSDQCDDLLSTCLANNPAENQDECLIAARAFCG